MDVNSHIQFGLLRNPLFIALFILLSVAPEVVIYCVNIGSDELVSSCSREVVKTSYLQNSFLSSSIVLIAFETQRFYFRKINLLTVPANVYSWIRAHIGMIFSSLSTLLGFVLINFVVKWLSGNSFELTQFLHPTYVLRVVLIVFLSYYFVAGYSKFRDVNNQLRRIINFGDGVDQNLELWQIHSFLKVGRKYFLCTQEENKMEIQMNLKDLEKKLPQDHFVRINRSAIVNIHEIKDFYHWEHEKYTLKLNCGDEFTVTRKRIVELKKILERQRIKTLS